MALQRGRDMAMARPHLDAIPEHPLPDGFILDYWSAGDEETWRRIHLLADHYNDFDDGSFRAAYGIDDREWARRIFFLKTQDGLTIGTSGAWWNDNWRGGHWGRVHWVAILPEYQGRGLARPMISATLLKLRELGHTRAYLTTNSVRERAIRLYEEFGFQEVACEGDDLSG